MADDAIAEPETGAPPLDHAAHAEWRDEFAGSSEPQAAAEARQVAAERTRRAVTHTGLVPDQAPPSAPAAGEEGEEDNPYAQFRADPADDGIGLLERQRLNRQEAFYRGTLAGSARLALLSNVFTTPDQPGTDPDRRRVNNGLRDEYRGIVGDLAAYDQMRPWGSTAEAATALAGQLSGSLLSPESFLGWGSKGATWLARTGRAALQQGTIQAAVNPEIQGLNIAGGVRSEFDPLGPVEAFGTGAAFGGGIHAGGELLGHVIGQALLRKQARELGREDPAFLGIVPHDAPDEAARESPDGAAAVPERALGDETAPVDESAEGKQTPETAAPAQPDELAGTVWAAYRTEDALRQQIDEWRGIVANDPSSEIAPHLNAMADDAERFLQGRQQLAPADGEPATSGGGETPQPSDAVPPVDQGTVAGAQAPPEPEQDVGAQVKRMFIDADRPEDEATQVGAVAGARYATRAQRLEGRAGTANDLFKSENIEVRRGEEPAGSAEGNEAARINRGLEGLAGAQAFDQRYGAIHSTQADFKEFTKFQTADSGYFGLGVYAYPFEHGSEYGRKNDGLSYGAVVERNRYSAGSRNVLLTIDSEKPFVVTYDTDLRQPTADFDALKAHGWDYDDVPHGVWSKQRGLDPLATAKQFTDALRAAGYDSVIVQWHRPDGSIDAYEMVGFKPNSVRGMFTGRSMLRRGAIDKFIGQLQAQQAADAERWKKGQDAAASGEPIDGGKIKEALEELLASLKKPAETSPGSGGPAPVFEQRPATDLSDRLPPKAGDLLGERRHLTEEAGDEGVRGFEQAGSSTPNARVTFAENKRIIDLFRTANASSGIHEFGHIWLDELMRDAARSDAPDGLKQDAATVLNWLGVEKPADIGTPHHEQFAQGFEQYLREGRAPSSALAQAFDAFKKWLSAIYRSVRELGAPISDEMRGVFDRLLATDDEIAAGGRHQGQAAPGDRTASATPSNVPTVDVHGVPVSFPDRDHADLFELGRRVREGGKLEPAEVERLFKRFDGHVVTDPEHGIEFRNWRDLGALARDYFDDVSEQAGRGRAFAAHDVIDPDAREAWYRRALAGPTGSPAVAPPRRQAKPPDLIGAPVATMPRHRVTTPDGRSVEVAPVVVEASDLITSADGGYDARLQPRQRERAASQAQIREIATRLDPERLGASAEADRGAPIVGHDGMIESGNGRVLAVRRAYEAGGEAAQRYRQWLAGQGVDVSKFRQPVLVRQRMTPLNPDDRRAFTVAANQSATLTLSASERAMADARHLDTDMLGLIRNADDLGAIANRDFVRSFVGKLPQAEQGAMMTAEGGLSAEGLTRIRNAVLARAYGDADVLARIAEATSDDVKSISNALVAAAPDWARLRADVEAGRVRADVDLTPALVEAVSRAADLRAKGVKLDAHLAQQDAFDRLSEPVENFMRMFYDSAGRRAAGAPRIADALRFYAEEARKVTAEAGLDLGLPEVGARDVQRAALKRATANEARPQQGGLFLRRSTDDGAGAAAARGEVRGPGPGAARTDLGAASPGGAAGRPAGSSAAELTSRTTWRSVLDAPEVRAAIEHPQIARGGDVPYGAGADNRPGITHVDKHLPSSIDVKLADGSGTRAIDPAEPLNVHEQVERYVMEKLIGQGVPRERAYLIAHHHFAVPAERDWIESRGLSWPHYTEEIAGHLDRIEHEHPANPPAGLYTKPYPHDEALLLAHAEHGGAAPIGSPDELALAQRRGGGLLRMESTRSAQGIAQTATAAPPSSGVPATVPTAPSPQQSAAIQSLQQQALALAKALGFPLREGRVRVRNALGTFNTRTGVVRVKEVPDFEVVAHEAGHAIEAKAGQELTDLTEHYPNELAPLVPDPNAYDPSLHVKEGFAEWIRRYLGNKLAAEKVAPGFTIAFRDFMAKNHPDMMAALDRASEAYRAYLDAPSVDAVGAVRRSRAENENGWRKVAQQIKEDGFPAVIKSAFQWAYTAILDDKAPIARAVRDLGRFIRDAEGGKLVALKAADNPEVLFRMVGRARQAALRDMQDGVRPYGSVTPEGPSLADAVTKAIGEASIWGKWNPAKKADFASYLIARRAEYLWRKFKAGLLPNPPAAFSHPDARVAMADLERANPNFKDASGMVHDYTRQLLRKQFEGGLIDADLYRKLLDEEFYVPFFRDVSDKPLAEGGNPAGTPSNPEGPGAYNAVKRMKGSSRDIMDPIESLMMQTFLANRTIRHNDVIRAFTNLASRAGTEGGRYVEPVRAKEAVKYDVNVSEVLERKARELGIDPDDAKVLAASVGDMYGGEDPLLGSFFRMEMTKKRGEPIVFYKEAGQLKAARFMAGKEGHALYETLTAAPEPVADLWMDLIRGAAVLKRSGIVTNPTFALSNYIRDQVAASILRSDYFPIVSGAKGIASELTQGESAKLYGYAGGVAGGASTGPVEHASEAEIDALARKGYLVQRLGGVAEVAATGRGWKEAMKGLLELSSVTEAGTRNSVFAQVFKAKKKQGLSDYEAMIEAAYQAQDLLDFSRHGSHTWYVRTLVPFVNAHVQGLDKAWRTIAEPLINKVRGDQVFSQESSEFRNAVAAAVKVGGLGASLGAMWAAVNWEKEAYRDASPYFKGTHFVAPLGDKIVVVPKPFELSLGFTAGEYAFARWMKDDPRAAGQFVEAAIQALAPPNMITDLPLVSTAMQVEMGKSLFTNRDIVPGELQRLQPSEQFNERTSALARTIGKAIGVSPMKVDFAIGDSFGTWGRDVMALSQGVDQDTPALNMEDRVFTRRFIKDPTRTSDVTTRFWDFMGQTTGKYNQDVATFDHLTKSFQDDQARAFLDRLPAAERAFVTLRSAADEDGKAAFNADERRLHPLQRAYDAVSLLTGLRKELTANAFKDFETGTNLKLDPDKRARLNDNLRELAQLEMRNALVITKEPGYADRQVLDVNDTMTKIAALSPAVASEIATRYATNRIYTTASVQQAWPHLRDELNRHGSEADVLDLALDAKAEGYEFGGDRVKKPPKRRVTIQPAAAP